MRFVFTGGGTGGHFYPLIAVAQSLNELQVEKKINELDLYYLSDTPYDRNELDRYGLRFRKVSAGKLRVYFSPLNILDVFKTLWGIVQALWHMLAIFPDAVFSKGGYAAFPVVVAARIWRIPVYIHESDYIPGRVNKISARSAEKIFLAFEESQRFFPAKIDKQAVGRPIRRELLKPDPSGAREFLHLHEELPVILIMGGSQGAEKINDLIIDILPELVLKYYVIHQTGRDQIKAVRQATRFLLNDQPDLADRYKPFGYLDDRGLRMAAGMASLVISRAGSGLFEIAAWGLPSILIPLPHSHGEHQLHNAKNYAESGACLVIEEGNLKRSVFLSELENLMQNPSRLNRMTQAAKGFHKPQAAREIAQTLVGVGEAHEK